MKITVKELKAMVKEALIEAKKKKVDEDVTGDVPQKGYEYAPVHDYSKPLGDKNLYKQQGASNFGPYTEEKAVRTVVKQAIAEVMTGPVTGQQTPVCQHMFGSSKKTGNIWETAMNMTEAKCTKCGIRMSEAHIGFKKLKNKLAHKKGVKDPAALAASIGAKKYGKKGMAKKAAAGRK